MAAQLPPRQQSGPCTGQREPHLDPLEHQVNAEHSYLVKHADNAVSYCSRVNIWMHSAQALMLHNGGVQISSGEYM